MKVFLAYAVMPFVVLASVPALAATLPPMTSYDTFGGNVIDPDKWTVSEAGSEGREAIRTLRTHLLYLTHIGYCDTTSNISDCESGQQAHFTTPGITRLADITAIQATVSPVRVLTSLCTSNAFPTSAGLELLGFFFNANVGTPPTPGSNVNDIRARIGLEHTEGVDATNVMQVSARVVQCTNVDCTNGTPLFEQNMGPITASNTNPPSTTLAMAWDLTANQFIFQRDGGALVTYTYSVPDDFEPGNPDKRIQAIVDVPGCTNIPRPSATLQGLFDNVFINTTAVAPLLAPEERGIITEPLEE